MNVSSGSTRCIFYISKKACYLIVEALGPYFKNILLQELKEEVYVSLEFDETTNVESKKELEIRVQF